MWTLQEAVTWVSTREPGPLASLGGDFGAEALKDPPVLSSYPINRRTWHETATQEMPLAECASLGPFFSNIGLSVVKTIGTAIGII